MSKKFCAVLTASVLSFASVQSASAMEGSDLVAKLDTNAPKFDTDGCKAARDAMANYDGHVAERILEGAVLGAVLGPFGLPMAIDADTREVRIANYLVQTLQTECGRQAMFPAYLDAANKGEAPAQAWVAQSYERGDGAPRDFAQALSWYQKAADQGFASATVNLGSMYFSGEGVPVDLGRAIALWQKAADDGSPAAKANLGEAYFEGKGVTQDYARAIALWNDAVKKYDPSAQADLGKAYLEGKGIAQNIGEALKDFRTASWNGSGVAQYELGVMYETGIAVPQNNADAYRWYSVAEQNGFADAAAKRQQLAAKLSPDDVKKQDAAASACFKSRFMNCP